MKIQLAMKVIRKIIPAVILIVLISCSQGNKNDRKMSQPRELPVMEVEVGDVTIYDDYPANIEGMQVIEIRPKIEGYIEKIYVQEGASVKKGQLLFHIKNPEYEEEVKDTKAGIESAESDLRSARLELEKVKPLVENDIINRFELESNELEIQAKQAALVQAKASLGKAKNNLGYTYINSPYDGVIGNIPYRVGALVSSSSSEALTTLSENSVMYVYFSMNERDLMSLSRELPGKNLQEKLSNLGNAQLILSDGSVYNEPGKIETASSLVETTTGAIRMKAVFPNSEGLLWSGASATVRLLHNYNSVLLIPQSSTSEVLNKKLVYVVDNVNKVKSTAIDVIPTNDGQYYIVNKGLRERDKIVLEGFTSLKDGDEIVPRMKDAITLAAKGSSPEIQKD